MRAMVFDGPLPDGTGPLVPRDLPVPDPGPGELLVRVDVCGVCRTDLHVVQEDLPAAKRPIVPGHQIVGTVERVGAGVAAARIGERVGVAWLQGTCGTCRFCTAGRENLCEDLRCTGYHVDGGFAEYAVVAADWAYVLPPEVDDDGAAPLLCAGIIGYRALRLSDVRPGGRLGLYGFGASAHIVIQIALHRGCEVYVSSRGEAHRALAEEMGAAWVGGEADAPPVPLDAAILFAPAGELVPVVLRALDRGGTLACAGIHMSPIPRIDYDSELFGERTIRSVTANTRLDALELLREAADIPIRAHTQPFALEDANAALAAVDASRVRGTAVLRVRPE